MGQLVADLPGLVLVILIVGIVVLVLVIVSIDVVLIVVVFVVFKIFIKFKIVIETEGGHKTGSMLICSKRPVRQRVSAFRGSAAGRWTRNAVRIAGRPKTDPASTAFQVLDRAFPSRRRSAGTECGVGHRSCGRF